MLTKVVVFYRYDSDKRMFPRYIEICTFIHKISGADPGYIEVGFRWVEERGFALLMLYIFS